MKLYASPLQGFTEKPRGAISTMSYSVALTLITPLLYA